APTDREGQKLPPWNVSDSQLWRYIRAADRLCKERCDARADHLLARHLLRRERLYAHALEVGDYKTALAVLRDEAQLEGHYQRDDKVGPLEKLLASLPPELARATRAALAALLSAGGSAGCDASGQQGAERLPDGPGGLRAARPGGAADARS